MKKFLIMLLAVAMLVSVSGCKKEQSVGSISDSSAKNQGTKEILDTKDGTIKCVGIEKAHSKLSDEENVYVIMFEFTNKKQEPQQCQDQFAVSCFQNNVEVDDIPTYNSEGGEHYKLLGNFFKEALNGGTITFGKGFVLEDSSPVTVIMRTNDGKYEGSASVTLNIEDIAVSEEITAEKVIADLQGEWTLDETVIVFSQNTVSFGGQISGTYTVNTETSTIEAEMVATDGKVTVKMPYEYEGGKLKVFNNAGKAMEKKQ